MVPLKYPPLALSLITTNWYKYQSYFSRPRLHWHWHWSPRLAHEWSSRVAWHMSMAILAQVTELAQDTLDPKLRYGAKNSCFVISISFTKSSWYPIQELSLHQLHLQHILCDRLRWGVYPLHLPINRLSAVRRGGNTSNLVVVI